MPFRTVGTGTPPVLHSSPRPVWFPGNRLQTICIMISATNFYVHSKMSRNKRTPLISLSISLALLAASSISGCTGLTSAGNPKGTSTNTTAISIATQPASQTVTAGQPAIFSVAATGTGTLAYQWKKNGTALSGAIASSYTTPATTSADNGAQFIVTVSDSTGNMTSNVATLTVNGSLTSQLTVPTTSLIQAFTNQSYSATMSVTGGTPGYTWSIVSGSLPSGMSLMPSTGQISGTPTIAGGYSFKVQISDRSSPQQTTTLPLALIVTLPVDQYGSARIFRVPTPRGFLP